MKTIFLFVAALVLVAISACTNSHIATSGGGGSEVEVVGTLYLPGNVPASWVQVRLVPEYYNPVFAVSFDSLPCDTTDSFGKYRLMSKTSGIFNVQAVHVVNGMRLLIRDIVVDKDNVVAKPDTLVKTGSIKIAFAENMDTVNGYAYIPGTTIFSYALKNRGYFMLDSVPAKNDLQIQFGSTTDIKTFPLRNNVSVLPGDTVTIRNPLWANSRTVVLNTSASGADISGMLTQFPVLIRLTSANFNFSEAKPDGADIMFTKSDNSTLPYEIERWDATNQMAELWVKIDTVRGNDSLQSIMMYWGAQASIAAQPASNSAAVFDTANGFQGVWHLGESSGPLNDATGNKYYGGRNGGIAKTKGEIGYGQICRDSGDFANMGNVSNPGLSDLTVSAWIKCGETGRIMTVISKSAGGLPSSTYGWLLCINSEGRIISYLSTGSDTVWGGFGSCNLYTNVAITDTVTWHHIVAVFDRSNNANCTIYLDGSKASTNRTGDITTVGALANAIPMTIGSEGDGGCPWIGSIDECIVSSAVRSADWVRLCYMNQRADDKLLLFR